MASYHELEYYLGKYPISEYKHTCTCGLNSLSGFFFDKTKMSGLYTCHFSRNLSLDIFSLKFSKNHEWNCFVAKKGCLNSRLKKINTMVHFSWNFPLTMVLIFCFEFWELSHFERDLSQAERRTTIVTSWATDKMTTIFPQNDNFDHFEWNRCHFVHLLSF